MTTRQDISLERAEIVAEEFLRYIARWCEKKMVVGSVRRGKAWVHDIDIVIIPKPRGALDIVLWAKAQRDGTRVMKMGRASMQILFRGIQIDLYLATQETWWTHVIIRTGSKEHNIQLCTHAKNMQLKLHADGRGLVNRYDQKIEVNSEEQFFERLHLAYRAPEERG